MTESIESVRFNTKKLDGTDFVLWKDKVLSALKATQCSEAIIEDFKSSEEENTLKDEKAKSTIKVGDGRSLKVQGIGDIHSQINLKGQLKNIKIKDVLFVPDLSVNLISIEKLSQKGYHMIFDKESCMIVFNDVLMAKGLRWEQNKNLYEIKLFFPVSLKSSDVKLWHFRLGHLSLENMKKLRVKDLVFRNENLKKDFCESCTLGKSTKLPHKNKTKHQIDENKVTIHSDLVRPLKTASIGSKIYILTYLCSRSEYFYLTNEFQKLLKDSGIQHNTSVKYCPQMNEKAERLNRTLIEKARYMLIGSNCHINLWSGALDTSNYLRKRSPSSALNGKSPFEVFYGVLPKLSHLRVLGCEAYPLNLNNHGETFETVAKRNCIMIGYRESEVIYWIYDKKNHKVFISRDVRFKENELLGKSETNDFTIEKRQKTRTFKLEESTNDDDYIDKAENQENVSNNDQNGSDLNRVKTFESNEKDKNSCENPIENQAPRRSNRCSKSPDRYNPESYFTQDIVSSNYLNSLESDEINDEPTSLEEAFKSPLKDKWKEAIKSELNTLEENEIWKLTSLPDKKKLIKTKWVFKIKRNSKNVQLDSRQD
ncbi:unnamed protein product [Brachionus calyciflorus]|uniref:Integrase catalytic domain-containing protein n=1 Tax=Brachionus calyciflorus TaxID=104777 RepID=A0A813QJM0_9BILA|nr:unnamed protein product [Brachionus calyciflorus]